MYVVSSAQNVMTGDAGNDFLSGDQGNDQIEGGDGSDTYVFQLHDGQDEIDNSAADHATTTDTLAFGSGISAGDFVLHHISDDLIMTIGATDSVTVKQYFAAGGDKKIDQIQFADGTLWNQAAIEQHVAPLVTPKTGDDILGGTGGSDTISGLAGNDTISGGIGNDQLFGNEGSDRINGDDGGDLLDGGAGADNLYGGSGSDTYVFKCGSGKDSIWEYAKQSGDSDTILMAAGIEPADIMVRRDYNSAGKPENLLLYIDKGTGSFDDAITVQGFFSNQDTTSKVEQVKFADGTTWNVAMIKAMVDTVTESSDTVHGNSWGDSLDGLGGDDTLLGYGGNDILSGGSGNDHVEAGDGNDDLRGGAGKDILEGGAGADSLDGGAGHDELQGSAGNDIYVFRRGYGSDKLVEANPVGGSVDTVTLGDDIAPADIALYRQGNSLVISVAGTQDQLWIAQFFTDQLNGNPADFRIEQLMFANGTVWDLNTIKASVVPVPANVLTGTAGNDTFSVDNESDTVSEAPNQGIDTIESSVSFTLSTNVDNLTLKGVLDINGFGNGLNNVIAGNSGNNYLKDGMGTDTVYGGGGDDTIDVDGEGDVLYGGAGDDTYRLNRVSTVVTIVEAEGEGADTLESYGGVLPDHIENMRITGYMTQGQNVATAMRSTTGFPSCAPTRPASGSMAVWARIL